MAKLPYYSGSGRYDEGAQDNATRQQLNLWAAADLARAGFSIFAVRSHQSKQLDKKPVSKDSWKTTSTSDLPKVVLIWERLHPGAMPAINLLATGHIVIDLDRHDDGPDGIAAWERISAGRELPENIPIVETPSGGRHLFFRQPEGREPLGNREGALKGLGINVRGHGGYVVGAGAVTVQGTFYGFQGSHDDLFNAPVIPRWLEDMIRGGEDPAQSSPPAEKVIQFPAGDRPNRRDLAALERELEDLENAPKGERNNQLNDTAFNLAQLANDGAFPWSSVEPRIIEAARACGLVKDDGMAQVRATIRSAYGAAKGKPKKQAPLHSEQSEAAASIVNWDKVLKGKKDTKIDVALQSEPVGQRAKKAKLPQIFNITELERKMFEAPKFLCEGIICEGSTILAGRPKAGKSWLALDFARGVATGGEVMGRKCTQGNVLYLALEDNQRRLKNRFEKIANDTDWHCPLDFANDWPKGEEAVKFMYAWAENAENPKLIIVDTLKKIKREPKGKNGESYSDDYAALEILQKFYIETGISNLIITHTTKMERDDPFDSITGTLGQTAAVDNIMVMIKDKSGTVNLHGKGRDMDDYNHVVKFNRETCKWELGGEYNSLVSSGIQKKILAFMGNQPGAVSPKEVSEAIGFKYDTVKKSLQRMAENGVVETPLHGKYLLVFGVGDNEY